MTKALYELSTGNNSAEGLHWHADTTSLYCMSSCTQRNINGYYENYPLPKNLSSIFAAVPATTFHPHCEPDPLAWPENSFHTPNDFKYWFNVKAHALLCYRFSENSASIVPATK